MYRRGIIFCLEHSRHGRIVWNILGSETIDGGRYFGSLKQVRFSFDTKIIYTDRITMCILILRKSEQLPKV